MTPLTVSAWAKDRENGTDGNVEGIATSAGGLSITVEGDCSCVKDGSRAAVLFGEYGVRETRGWLYHEPTKSIEPFAVREPGGPRDCCTCEIEGSSSFPVVGRWGLKRRRRRRRRPAGRE